MVKLRGVATETVKNIVLAGIGRLVVADAGHVSEEDLGAGFFFRDEDVGKEVIIFGVVHRTLRDFTLARNSCKIAYSSTQPTC